MADDDTSDLLKERLSTLETRVAKTETRMTEVMAEVERLRRRTRSFEEEILRKLEKLDELDHLKTIVKLLQKDQDGKPERRPVTGAMER